MRRLRSTRTSCLWPPGRVTSLYYPVGTSVGNTDSVPLLSLPLKLVNTWLPDEFQFLGFWMLACVALQGAFAGLLMRAAGGSWPYQSLGVFFFLLSPSAVPSVERVGLHTGRWLTLAALWLAEPRAPEGRGRRIGIAAALCGFGALCAHYVVARLP